MEVSKVLEMEENDRQPRKDYPTIFHTLFSISA